MSLFARKFRLTNGLTVIYEHNPAVDVVSLNIGVKVGSVDEKDDESGMCHMIEHMVFKGTKTFKPGEIATLVEAGGGELNAYTSLDQTVYYVNVPAKTFALGMNILKEMVFDAVFDGKELEREKEVVVEEILRGQDSPQRVLGEMLFAGFFDVHPYRRPVIGTPELVRGFTREKVFDFYRRWYRPQNMVLGVCGNVSEADFNVELERGFRFEIASPEEHRGCSPEPERTGRKIVTHSMAIQATFFDIAFHAPHIHHADVPALDVLSHLLGEGDTSLLVQNTKEKERLVHSVYSSNYTPRHPGMLVIGGMVDVAKIGSALASIRRQIELAKTTLFASAKLARVKTLLETQIIFDKETCEGTARKWMTYETVAGDYLYDEKYLAMVAELTPEDIRKAALTYLDTSKSVLAILHSRGVKPRPGTGFFSPEWREKTRPRKRVYGHGDSAVYELKNGIRVIVRQNSRLPLAAVRLTMIGGLRAETPRNNGISNLMAHALIKGTRTRGHLELAEQCEMLAANLFGYAGRNTWGGSLSILSTKLGEGFPLFADVILNPAFDKNEVDKEKTLQLEAIKNRNDNPSQMAFALAMRSLYPGQSFRMHLAGETASVKSLTSQRLKDFHRGLCAPRCMVLAVSGDVNAENFLALADDYFGALPDVKPWSVKTPASRPPKKRLDVFTPMPRQQAHAVIGFVTASLKDPDRYVLDVINSVLSGQGGRLFLELRDRQSLGYSISSSVTEGLDTGFFGVYIGTEPSKVPTALRGMFLELEKLCGEKIPADELARAKNYIIGNHEIEHQKNGAVAMQLALNELYGIGVKEFHAFAGKIAKVSSSDVRRVARRYFDPARCVVSVVGPKGTAVS